MLHYFVEVSCLHRAVCSEPNDDPLRRDIKAQEISDEIRGVEKLAIGCGQR